jgi:phospholipid N-methyltransferase
MGAIKFFIQGIKNFKEVGTFSRSSKFVGRAMTKPIDFSKVRCVVELGAGDGSITKEILKCLHPEAKLLSFEINEEFCQVMREKLGSDARLQVIQDDAKKMGEYIKAAGFEAADCVISAIPFVIIPEDDIIEEAKNCMKTGAKYVQLHYSKIASKRYRKIFGNLDIDFVMLNIPPAFIHICEKRD